MSDDLLFREVDEEVRREELEGLWKKYGTLFIALCIGVVAAVGGIKGWQYWQKTQAEAAGATYYDAVRLASDGKTKQAEAALAKIKAKNGAIAIFADFKQAGALASAGKTAEAVIAYDKIAADSKTSLALKNLAQIKAAYLLANTTTLDDVKKRVDQFDNAQSPWRNAAREIIAIAAYRAKNYQLADRKLNEIVADTGATQGARQRAQIFLSVLRPLLAAKKPK